jgi:hypothetical protein
LLRLIEGVAYSSVILRSFRDETRKPRPRKSAAGKAADLLRKARMNERERRFHAAVERGENRARRELETS